MKHENDARERQAAERKLKGPANPATERPKTLSLKVRAIQPGYIGDGPLGMIYRNPGDVFTLVPREIPFLNLVGKPELDADGRLKTKWLTAEQQFSANWMEVVHDDEPERLTTAQQDINRQIAELNAGGRPRPDEESSRNQF